MTSGGTAPWVDAVGSVRAVAVFRILLGPVVLLHLRPFLTDAAAGRYFGDRFTEPFAAWYPVAGPGVHAVLLWAAAVGAVLLTVGLATRVAAVATWAVVTYNLFLSETHFHQNRAFLVILLTGLVLLPCGRALSVDAWLARRGGRPPSDLVPLWPLWLLRFEASAVYLASGTGKLLDADWWGGTVTWDRIVQVRAQVEASPLPGWAVELLLDRDVHTVAAKIVVLTEVAVGLGLWSRHTRPAAAWLAISFHLAIELSASVQVFSFAAVAALLLWVTPRTRDRLLLVPSGDRRAHLTAAVIARLDWLARFRIEDGRPGSSLTLVERDGRRTAGWAAAIRAGARVPLLFWPLAPLLLLPGARPSAAAAAPGTHREHGARPAEVG